MSIGAGTGLIYLLRWFWWRINAWSEIAAMVSSFVVSVGFFVAARAGYPVASHVSLLITVATTTVVWIAVTYLTAPTDPAVLDRFYQLARPAGPGWGPIRARTGLSPQGDSLPQALLAWALGCAFVYSALFGAGSFLYGNLGPAALWTVVFVTSGGLLVRMLPKMWASPTR
ncbi:MAG: hypothetical protein JNJ80_18585 [Gemmatimonadetes bacterium]|nr:hypothetical protein [Gemmatimonadota bacterium]